MTLTHLRSARGRTRNLQDVNPAGRLTDINLCRKSYKGQLHQVAVSTPELPVNWRAEGLPQVTPCRVSGDTTVKSQSHTHSALFPPRMGPVKKGRHL